MAKLLLLLYRSPIAFFHILVSLNTQLNIAVGKVTCPESNGMRDGGNVWWPVGWETGVVKTSKPLSG